MISLHPDGIILNVKALPGSKRDEVRGEQDHALKVCVTQIPEKGKANQAIRKLLVKSLRLRAAQVELLSGETASQKKFLIRGMEMETLKQRIAEILATH